MKIIKLGKNLIMKQSTFKSIILTIFLYSFLHFCKDTWYYLTDIIVILAYYVVINKYESTFLIKYFKENRVYVVVMSCCISFGLVGNYLLFFSEVILVFKILLFFAISTLFVPLAIAILNRLERFNFNNFKGISLFKNERVKYAEEISRKKVFIIIFTLVFLVELIYLIAFYPGIISYDVYYVLEIITSGKAYWEHQSLFYHFLLDFLLRIVNEVSFLVLIQILYFTLIYSIIVSWLIKCIKHANWKLFIGIAVFIAMWPNNGSLIITLSKDVPYAISFMWLIYLLVRLKNDKNKILYLQLIVALSLIILFRQNGWVIAFGVLFACLILYDNKKILAGTFVCSFFIVLCTNFGIKMTHEYLPTDPMWKYVAGCNDMIGIYYEGGELSDDTTDMVEAIITEELKENYTPYWTYHEFFQESVSEIKVLDFIRNYINTFLHNPYGIVRAICLRLDMLWDISLGKDGGESWQWLIIPSTNYLSFTPPPRKDNILMRILSVCGNLSLKHPIKEILWRGGIWLQLHIALFLNLVKRDKRNLVWFSPMVANILSFILALAWHHFRYYWWLQLSGLVLVAAYLSINGADEKNKK